MDGLIVEHKGKDLARMLNKYRVSGFKCNHIIYIGVPSRFNEEKTKESIFECPICADEPAFSFSALSGPVWWAEEEITH